MGAGQLHPSPRMVYRDTLGVHFFIRFGKMPRYSYLQMDI
jgi:hypothetical protein